MYLRGTNMLTIQIGQKEKPKKGIKRGTYIQRGIYVTTPTPIKKERKETYSNQKRKEAYMS